MKYNLGAIVKQALNGQRGWQRAWRSASPKKYYDVIIVGGGGHGLAAAYYLAKNHGITNVAVLEKGWIGGGNAGRNTTIVRSNYELRDNARFYEHSLKLWENLSVELNFNTMFSQRGAMIVAQNDGSVDYLLKRGNAMRLQGIDAQWLSADEVRNELRGVYSNENARLPIYGGLMQRRGGSARHDAVVWGYARAASALGVDIIENCEVTDFLLEGEKVQGVQTSRGSISAGATALSVAGHSGHLAAKAGIRLPVESHLLQAFVTEPVKPLIDTVAVFSGLELYISQSDKGGLVFGGELDGYNSYSQRGSFSRSRDIMKAAATYFPMISRLKVLRQWAGVVDMTMDGSPIMHCGPLDNLYLNAGWCYGGFKGTPAAGWCLAHSIAENKAHQLAEGFSLDRFKSGKTIDEPGTGPTTNAH